MHVDCVIHNVTLATMRADHPAPYGAIADGVLAVQDQKIAWLGTRSEAPDFDADEVIDGRGGWLTPGLIDCHTHLVYFGNRAHEFALRQSGVSYQQIAREGGGILSTVRATREASDEEIIDASLARLRQLQREGVTTVEIKSGYGLSVVDEIRLLRLARQIESQAPVTITTSFLGAHALPPEFSSKDEYINCVCHDMLPEIAQQHLADAVDVFCDDIAFSIDQCRKVFSAARALGLPVRAHAEQLRDLGGAQLVAEFNGLSADHLEYLSEPDVDNLARAGVVAVLLPIAYYFLRETQRPPINALRNKRVPMAVATDCNPGSAPAASLLLAMNQACILFGLSSQEVWMGVTCHAAKALRMEQSKGILQTDFDADLVMWPVNDLAEVCYSVNMIKPTQVWQGGKNVLFT